MRRDNWASSPCGSLLEVAVLSLLTSSLQLLLPAFGTCLPCVHPLSGLDTGSHSLAAWELAGDDGPMLPPPPTPWSAPMGNGTTCSPHLSRPEVSSVAWFGCDGNHYNDLATLLFSDNNPVVASMVETATNAAFTLRSLTLYLAFTFLFAGVTYGAAVPSGLFTPHLLVGSVLGFDPPRAPDIRAVARFTWQRTEAWTSSAGARTQHFFTPC